MRRFEGGLHVTAGLLHVLNQSSQPSLQQLPLRSFELTVGTGCHHELVGTLVDLALNTEIKK